MESVLWIEKHRPYKIQEITGQDKAVSEVLGWFNAWKPGKALLLHGPPGTGKSLLVELIARERGFELLQLSASDKRGAADIEAMLGDAAKQKPLFGAGKIILMDELDGISGGERGAAGSIAKLIKESRFPVVLIANDPWLPKLRPLRPYCSMVRMGKVRSPSIVKKLREICAQEGINAGAGVLENLARWSQGDMRSAIIDLQTACEGRKLTERELGMLGHRERESDVFSILSTILYSRNMKAARKAIFECDRDPDEILWWIEENMPRHFSSPQDVAQGFDLLSRADIFRNRVLEQQNWRFKAYMSDMLAGMSLAREGGERDGFTPYQSPQRLAQMGRTRQSRAIMEAACRKLGEHTHCSGGVVRRELPYLRMFLKGCAEQLGLEPEEARVAGI